MLKQITGSLYNLQFLSLLMLGPSVSIDKDYGARRAKMDKAVQADLLLTWGRWSFPQVPTYYGQRIAHRIAHALRIDKFNINKLRLHKDSAASRGAT